MTEAKLAPIGLEVGDMYRHPHGLFEIEEVKGEYGEREWYIRDIDTGEELWVDWDFLMEISLANISKGK